MHGYCKLSIDVTFNFSYSSLFFPFLYSISHLFFLTITFKFYKKIQQTHPDSYIIVAFVVSSWICQLCYWSTTKLSFLDNVSDSWPLSLLCGQFVSLQYWTRGRTLQYEPQKNTVTFWNRFRQVCEWNPSKILFNLQLWGGCFQMQHLGDV